MKKSIPLTILLSSLAISTIFLFTQQAPVHSKATQVSSSKTITSSVSKSTSKTSSSSQQLLTSTVPSNSQSNSSQTASTIPTNSSMTPSATTIPINSASSSATTSATTQTVQPSTTPSTTTTTTSEAPVEEVVIETPSIVETTTTQTVPNAQPVYAANQLIVAGHVIAIEQSQGANNAPTSGNAGYWIGDGSTTDGALSYLIGHNTGAFGCLFSQSVGQSLQLIDGYSNPRTYTIHTILEVNDDGFDRSGNDVYSTITTASGESLHLQTCIDDFWNLVILAD